MSGGGDRLPQWCVVTPPYDACDDYDEVGRCILSYEARDFGEVEAPTRRDAVRVAVSGWLAETPRDRRGRAKWTRFPNYCVGRRQDGLCPWTGIRAYTFAEYDAILEPAA